MNVLNLIASLCMQFIGYFILSFFNPDFLDRPFNMFCRMLSFAFNLKTLLYVALAKSDMGLLEKKYRRKVTGGSRKEVLWTTTLFSSFPCSWYGMYLKAFNQRAVA